MNLTDAADIEKLLGRWVNGAPSAPATPESWRPALDGLPDSEADLRRLALAGQALQTAFRPRPVPQLTIKPTLPALSLPALPDAARSLFRRLFGAVSDPVQRSRILRLMAARGRTAHPFDWLPGGESGEFPEVYSPWFAWQTDADGASSLENIVTEENWEQFFPAERVNALKQMRREDPAAVIRLFEAKFGEEAAETRVKLMAVLEVNLGEGDQAFLESLANDRSGKVKQAVRSLLARLGATLEAGEDLDELADFFSVTKRGARLSPAPTKNKTQRARRAELLMQAELNSLAGALELSPDGLIEAWRFGEEETVDVLLSDLIARTGSDALVELWAERVFSLKRSFEAVMHPLAERLNQSQRRKAANLALGFGLPLPKVVFWAEADLGTFPEDVLRTAPAWKDAIQAVREEMRSSEVKGRGVADDLFDLSLLADAQAARSLLDQITRLGLTPFDPRLLLLQLNTLLSPTA